MKTCQKILLDLGIESLPAAPNNAPTARRNGLKYHLRHLVNGEPGFLLSSACPQIREGLMGHFQYASVRSNDGMESRYHETPLKNMHSHICEALEYISMYYAISEKEDKCKADDIVRSLAQYQARINQIRARV